MTQRPPQRQLRQPAPAFKVLLIPNSTTPVQSYSDTAIPEESEAYVHPDHYHDHPQYPPNYQGYENNYRYQDEDEYPTVGGAASYPPGTIEEL